MTIYKYFPLYIKVEVDVENNETTSDSSTKKRVHSTIDVESLNDAGIHISSDIMESKKSKVQDDPNNN